MNRFIGNWKITEMEQWGKVYSDPKLLDCFFTLKEGVDGIAIIQDSFSLMNKENSEYRAPEALMLLGTHCPHCPSVLRSLSELVEQGELSKLEVVNLKQHPDIAHKLGVRSVPWVRIGPFELAGLRTLEELKRWAHTTATHQGIRDYLGAMLAEGEVDKVLAMIVNEGALMARVIELLDDADTKINIRLGIGVIIEEYQGTPLLQEYIPQLGKLTLHMDPRVRGDACHYLALSHSYRAKVYIQPLLQDENADVREIARESLDELELE